MTAAGTSRLLLQRHFTSEGGWLAIKKSVVEDVSGACCTGGPALKVFLHYGEPRWDSDRAGVQVSLHYGMAFCAAPRLDATPPRAVLIQLIDPGDREVASPRELLHGERIFIELMTSDKGIEMRISLSRG